ncbi:lipoprotein [Salmonella phage PHA46_2]
MFGADVAIMIMYVLGFACTGMIAFLVFIPAMVMSVCLGWVLVDSFPAEYLYYLAQSMVWLLPQYAFIIIGIHLFILSITFKWGGEIGHYSWRGRHCFFADSNL